MNLKVHFIYVTIILLSIIILLFTINVGANENLVGYFNFALTISSILLALIAIFYSFISNSTISKNLFSITKSAKKISNVSDELGNTTNLLISKMDEVPILLKGVDKKVEDSIHFMKELKREKENPLSFNSIPEMDEDKIKVNEISDLWAKFLSKSSLSYLTFLYALSLSLNTRKPFNFDDYVKLIEGDEQYLLGGKVIFIAFGVISLVQKDNIWNVIGMNEYIRNNIKDSVYKFAKKMDEETKSSLGLLKNINDYSFMKDIKLVEDYFK